ncbi:MAG: hypothetical protein M1825_000656 [Sarcosagium campestre]|nr:MAG: hypothetical protein M1825_000656 [Sarcosagium campestre]
MDRLEQPTHLLTLAAFFQTKAENPNNDAILDDVAGQAYIEQFALETFQRADNAVQANRVSGQTADTFRAAATFLDLLRIWGEPDAEISSKNRYAKFHALRIAKAIKAGEDPNLSNPRIETPRNIEDDPPAGQHAQPTAQDAALPQPFVQDVPDDEDMYQAGQTAHHPPFDQHPPPLASHSPFDPNRALDTSPPLVPSPPNEDDNVQAYYRNAGQDDDVVSPIEPSPPLDPPKNDGGYFPDVPTFSAEDHTPSMPTAPPDASIPDPSGPILPSAPDILPHTASRTTAPEVLHSTLSQVPPPIPPVIHHQSVSQKPTSQPHPQTPQYYHNQEVVQPQLPVSTTPATQNRRSGDNLTTDEEAIMQAQKHARWAISALNFEDVKTAVKELRGALDSLGAAT